MPDVTVWTAPRQSSKTGELLAQGPLLLTFYLFDWSST
jgi:hypothetical protein